MSFDGSVLYKNEEGNLLRYLSLCVGGVPMKTLSDVKKDCMEKNLNVRMAAQLNGRLWTADRRHLRQDLLQGTFSAMRMSRRRVVPCQIRYAEAL
jgi:hypothetical protein